MNTLLLESLSRVFSAVPSAAPANFSLVSQTPTSFTVTWEPVLCMYHNGLITGYVIKYKELLSIQLELVLLLTKVLML